MRSRLLGALYFSMISCINFRYFTAPASKFSKPPCEIFFISSVTATPFFRRLYRKYKLAKRIYRAQKSSQISRTERPFCSASFGARFILELAVNFL